MHCGVLCTDRFILVWYFRRFIIFLHLATCLGKISNKYNGICFMISDDFNFLFLSPSSSSFQTAQSGSFQRSCPRERKLSKSFRRRKNTWWSSARWELTDLSSPSTNTWWSSANGERTLSPGVIKWGQGEMWKVDPGSNRKGDYGSVCRNAYHSHYKEHVCMCMCVRVCLVWIFSLSPSLSPSLLVFLSFHPSCPILAAIGTPVQQCIPDAVTNSSSLISYIIC